VDEAPRDLAQKAATAARLEGIKVLHTIIWAFFAGCIFAIPVLALINQYTYAAALIAVVFVEVIVILLNKGHCPLTPVAARYTSDRRDNFDIYLPQWLARNNISIFGALYIGGIILTAILWTMRRT
jgi:hypothetical protein